MQVDPPDPPRSSQSDRRSPEPVFWKHEVDQELMRRLKEAEINAVAAPPPTQSTRTSRLLAQSPLTRLQPRRIAHYAHPYSPIASTSAAAASSTSTIRPRRTRSLPQARSPAGHPRVGQDVTTSGAGRSQSLPTAGAAQEDVVMDGSAGGSTRHASLGGDRLDQLIGQVQARLGQQALEAAVSKNERRGVRRSGRPAIGGGVGAASAMRTARQEGPAPRTRPSDTVLGSTTAPQLTGTGTPLRTARTSRPMPLDTPTRVLRERTRAGHNVGAASPRAFAPGAGLGASTSKLAGGAGGPGAGDSKAVGSPSLRSAGASKSPATAAASAATSIKSPSLKSAIGVSGASRTSQAPGHKPRHEFKTPFLKRIGDDTACGTTIASVGEQASQGRAPHVMPQPRQAHPPVRLPSTTTGPVISARRAGPGLKVPASDALAPGGPPTKITVATTSLAPRIAPAPPPARPLRAPPAPTNPAPPARPVAVIHHTSAPSSRAQSPNNKAPTVKVSGDGDGDDSMEFSDPMDGLLLEHSAEVEAFLAGL